jgi:hypothetical protein
MNSNIHKRSAPPPWMIPASAEVAEYAIENRCPGARVALVVCPCGITRVVVCMACGIPILFLTLPGRWCTHAEVLRRQSLIRWQAP